MVKMVNSGVTVEVYEADMDFYKRAGYTIVVEEKSAPKKVKADPEK